MRFVCTIVCIFYAVLSAAWASNVIDYKEPSALHDLVAAGQLPAVTERLPAIPYRDTFMADQQIGQYGGELRLLMAKQKDIRMMVVYGYARLVGYSSNQVLVSDILQSYDVQEGRIYTLHLRPGHKWSDGHPFTTEDFRYYWESIALNPELSPLGPPHELKIDGKLPAVSIINETTVRYTWPKPNPYFLDALAGSRPLFIYRPSHYLKQFHQQYADSHELTKKIKHAKLRNWAELHHRRDRMYKFDNIDLPTLQPWVNTTPVPADRFVFKRNPYYHRIDSVGQQLPYIDRVTISIVDDALVSAKTAAGEADLQGRYLRLDNYTFLKTSEQRNGYRVLLWKNARGAQIALYPNLNANHALWRQLMQDVRFRRALSLPINREEINQVVYFGLAEPGNNTVLSTSPLFKQDYRHRWATFDIKRANLLLDELGLVQRDKRGVRLLSNGQPAEIVIQAAGESTEETDILELVHDSWLKVGIKLYTKASQRDVFRNRVFAGDAIMSVWSGIENALATDKTSPFELAPVSRQLQWPKWGLYLQTKGQSGLIPNSAIVQQLYQLYEDWRYATTAKQRIAVWHKMLGIHAEYVFTIGLVRQVPQPIVVNQRLQNVPEQGIYSWRPTAYFGVYRPDRFWFK